MQLQEDLMKVLNELYTVRETHITHIIYTICESKMCFDPLHVVQLNRDSIALVVPDLAVCLSQELRTLKTALNGY